MKFLITVKTDYQVIKTITGLTQGKALKSKLNTMLCFVWLFLPFFYNTFKRTCTTNSSHLTPIGPACTTGGSFITAPLGSMYQWWLIVLWGRNEPEAQQAWTSLYPWCFVQYYTIGLHKRPLFTSISDRVVVIFRCLIIH